MMQNQSLVKDESAAAMAKDFGNVGHDSASMHGFLLKCGMDRES